MLTKVDWNELSLHGLKMKPEIKLSFAFNLSSRHNLARIFLAWIFVIPFVKSKHFTTQWKFLFKSGAKNQVVDSSAMLQFEQYIFDK